jgi:sarcosine oxidase gamma subunit
MLTAPFDILKKQKDGSYIWLEAVRDIEKAKARLEQLCAISPGEYFVFDQKSQQIVAQLAADAMSSGG